MFALKALSTSTSTTSNEKYHLLNLSSGFPEEMKILPWCVSLFLFVMFFLCVCVSFVCYVSDYGCIVVFLMSLSLSSLPIFPVYHYNVSVVLDSFCLFPCPTNSLINSLSAHLHGCLIFFYQNGSLPLFDRKCCYFCRSISPACLYVSLSLAFSLSVCLLDHHFSLTLSVCISPTRIHTSL